MALQRHTCCTRFYTFGRTKMDLKKKERPGQVVNVQCHLIAVQVPHTSYCSRRNPEDPVAIAATVFKPRASSEKSVRYMS
jgi:hypothetical protein